MTDTPAREKASAAVAATAAATATPAPRAAAATIGEVHCKTAAVLLEKAHRLPDMNPPKSIKAAGALITKHCAPGFGRARAKRRRR
jgi:hypothetical protein